MNLLAVVLAAATGDPAPVAQTAAGTGADDALTILRAQPQLIGVALALFGLIPLFIGWSLVRWASALLTGALTVAELRRQEDRCGSREGLDVALEQSARRGEREARALVRRGDLADGRVELEPPAVDHQPP